MNNKSLKSLFALAAMSAVAIFSADAQSLKMKNQVVRITAYEASTSVNLVVVKPEKKLDQLDPNAFIVETNGVPRNVKIVYTCDDRGEWCDNGDYLAFGLEYSSDRKAAPLVASFMGSWSTAYPVKVALKPGKYVKVAGKKITNIECETPHALRNFLSESDFFSRGTYTGAKTGLTGDVTLTYGAYEPWALKSDSKKNPLIIWLHGMGEGGLDVSIELMGNEVVSLIREDIQSHFTTEGGEGGAYVLAVQCPTFWMQTPKGMGMGDAPSIYSDVLKSCIDNYVTNVNPDVDRNRIYIGGCSNGGYMTMNMLIRHPHFFAAAYPTCEAYKSEFISDIQIASLANENIWFVQSFDDTTVDPKSFAMPTYERLIAAGAKNVWLSMFECVNGHDFPGTKLFGHFSWCYLFNDMVTGAQEKSIADLKPTNNGGGTVAPQGHANIFEWMNAQVLTEPEAPKMPFPMGGGAPAKQEEIKDRPW
ncbi:MAG: prolyl oligopeptidase family serine peptidase [Bacteroidales bacterium]|nr:prolyl oligopeptidase family serine peptidase [Bacteroidales bacterium]